ncbi:uncharacterized protein LOC125421909 [Ziziphus jujuba]|uniref:Uncharacterized protein LOC125421909 n=1 Tax=Ziziphus jujuba TaxID=326968 RepID=A0ABM3IGP9_ZIZJJ|nr:uncharacterized protein LOC125421909 [Ziziphus jujuba]
MSSDISENMQYAIDDNDHEVEELEAITEMDGALLRDLLEELENEEIGKNNNNNVINDHKDIAGNEGTYGNVFLKQQDQLQYSSSSSSCSNFYESDCMVDLMEIGDDNNKNKLPSDIDEIGGWYREEDDMVGMVEFGCNYVIGGDYDSQLYYNHGVPPTASYTTSEITYTCLWGDS